MVGYSGTPLARKLGIKAGERVVALDAPAHYRGLLTDLPASARIEDRLTTPVNFVHLFVTERARLRRDLRSLRKRLDDSGVLWVSWPKKSSGVSTDVTEDVIRNEALPLGFVDVKVCALDETWSGLKLMIRRTERKADARR
jgi:hypothetical protein